MKRIVLAYSGSLESTVAIRWLIETYGAEIVTVTLDIGQALELAHVRERALAVGAVRAHVLDTREEFVRGYILPALRSGAFSPDREFSGVALSRPLIAKRLVDMARMESAAAVAHACTRDLPDRRMLEASIHALDPALAVLSPACKWRMSSSELADYARARNIDVPTSSADHAVQANVCGRVISGTITPDGYRLTRPVADAPESAAFVTIEFENGLPVRANGVEMPLVEMIESIETIAGTHGVGRMPGPGGSAAESPAAVVLHAAYTELATLADADRARGGVRVKLLKGACEATALQPVA